MLSKQSFLLDTHTLGIFILQSQVCTHISEHSHRNKSLCVCMCACVGGYEFVNVNSHTGGSRCVSLLGVSHEFMVWPERNGFEARRPGVAHSPAV